MSERLMIRRLVAKVELLVGAVAVGLAFGLAVVQPRTMGFVVTARAFRPTDLLVPGALLVALVGYGWMWRIATADPEAGPSSWRYRQD